jgi:uncharacterized protein (TIGR04255 family)
MRIMIDQPFGPAIRSIPLPNSPLSFVVAQIRFPVVASIADQAFIGPFQERIRSTYADLRREEEQQVTIGPAGAQAQQPGVVWRFTDDENRWEVALAPEFLALATNSYTNRADFLGRLGILLEALTAWINPRKVRRLGVRYIDRVGEEYLSVIDKLVRPEVLGPMAVAVDDSSSVRLQHSLTDCQYQFPDDTALRARWGFLPPRSTFDPAVDPIESRSWVLDLDASHGERPFDAVAIQDYVQLLSDRIYRYFRWAVTDEFLTAFGARS